MFISSDKFIIKSMILILSLFFFKCNWIQQLMKYDFIRTILNVVNVQRIRSLPVCLMETFFLTYKSSFTASTLRFSIECTSGERDNLAVCFRLKCFNRDMS